MAIYVVPVPTEEEAEELEKSLEGPKSLSDRFERSGWTRTSLWATKHATGALLTLSAYEPIQIWKLCFSGRYWTTRVPLGKKSIPFDWAESIIDSIAPRTTDG